MSEAAAGYDVPVRTSARERLLAAAEALFYEEGINAVGIDRVIERAGVAKASLYNIFGSKEELVRAYLAAKHDRRQERMTAHLQRFGSPRARLLGVFELQEQIALEPGYRGCAFVRAFPELKQGSAVKAVCDESRAWLRGLFESLAQEAGAKRPAELAAQLTLLYDGATVATQMDGDTAAPGRARSLAGDLVTAAIAATG